MPWKISSESSGEITRVHRFEFEIGKNFDDLIDSRVGLSVDDGKIIMASRQRFLVEQQCILCPLVHIARGQGINLDPMPKMLRKDSALWGPSLPHRTRTSGKGPYSNGRPWVDLMVFSTISDRTCATCGCGSKRWWMKSAKAARSRTSTSST